MYFDNNNKIISLFFCNPRITDSNSENTLFTKKEKKLRKINDLPQPSQSGEFCASKFFFVLYIYKLHPFC